MIQVGWNYGKKESCPICLQANDTQNHLIECTFLNDKNTATNYDIEKNNNYNLTQHMIRLEAATRKREIILEERQKQTDTVSPHVNQELRPGTIPKSWEPGAPFNVCCYQVKLHLVLYLLEWIE